MRTFSIALFLLACVIQSACASSRITASITVTNATTNGMTFTVGSDTRTFTNQVYQPSVQVLTNSDATGNGSKTNLFSQIGLNLFSQLSATDTGSNTFQLAGPCGYTYSVTLSAGLGSVSYSTQTCASATPLAVPFANYYPVLASRTNTASQAIQDLNDYSTNAISQSAPIAGQLLGTSNTQTVYGSKNLSSTGNVYRGSLVAASSIGGTVSNLTGGTYSNALLPNCVSSNLVNIGSALSSPGAGVGSQQFGSDGTSASADKSIAIGSGTIASGGSSMAIGFNAGATNDSAIALGAEAISLGQNSIALGASAEATTSNSIAIGEYASVSAPNSIAIGTLATVSSYQNSVAIGTGAQPDGAYQVMLGAPTISTKVQNRLDIGTDLTVGGNVTITGVITNPSIIGLTTFTNADIAFTRKSISSLANGVNAAVPVGTNEFIEVSGPTGSFSIDGIANGRDGKLITIVNQTGFQMTIANESGSDPTAANRIRTLGAASGIVLTNSAVTLQYNGNNSRWLVISHNP